MSVAITIHGADRVRERMGIPKRAVSRTAELAFREGARRTDFSGGIRRYLDFWYLDYERAANDMRVYADHVFIFSNGVLITAWRLPNRYRKAAHNARAS